MGKFQKWDQILKTYDKVPFVEDIDSRDINIELAQCMMMDSGLKDLIDADEMIYGMPQYYWKALASKLKSYGFLQHETEKIMNAYAGPMWYNEERDAGIDGPNRLHVGIFREIYKESEIQEDIESKVEVKGMTKAEEMATYIWETADYVTRTKDVVTFTDSQETRIYEDGVYPAKKRELELNRYIADTALRLFDCRFVSGNISNTLDRIKYLTAVDREEFDVEKNKIVLRNGILNLTNMEFLPHGPDNHFTSKVNVQYDPRLIELSSEFDYFLNSTFKGCETQIDIVQELFGYCLYKKYTFEHFFFLIGGGANGKSTLLNILTRFIGEENISNLSLHEIVKPKDDHVLCDLYGKMVNICGEIGNSKIADSRNLKIVTGRDKIRTRQLYKESFSFFNYAKAIFSMNEAPAFEDFTDAFKRRVLMIDFPNQFNKGDDGTRTDLEDLCTTDESLTRILNWSIVGLKRLLSNGEFSHQDTNAEKGFIYDRKSNPVGNFVQDRIVDDDQNYIEKIHVLEEYMGYAKKYNLPTLSKSKFNKMFLESCKEIGIAATVKQVSPSIDAKRPLAYFNIGFREAENVETMKAKSEMERDFRIFISNNIELKPMADQNIVEIFLSEYPDYYEIEVGLLIKKLRRNEWIHKNY